MTGTTGGEQKALHDLARVGATIHRKTCRHYRRAADRGSPNASLWNWPNQFATLEEAFWATPPWLNACQTCDPFDLSEEGPL